ncbi:hypothetical protein DYU11_19255 [Fibrisoma montanum]|uniref:Uncharacterized protein n=1 Tax=Fibrisoma montanum TaxID=2305895 RepID=A0A418M6J6_9BACT|nr:hypothetical protein [Fibrisoma montanum]RIV21540.1 hypothetical protein DYU11_19255 [Fibrisoma montanum]
MHCSNSPLSTEEVTDPSLLQVNFLITRRDGNDIGKSSTIEAYVRDQKGKSVANAAIKLKVNGKALRLNNGSVNYYGAFPFYELRDSSVEVKGNTDYVFTVVMTDGQEHTLGRIRTQPDLTSDRLVIPAKLRRNQALTIQWDGVEQQNFFVSLWKRCLGEGSRSELKIYKIKETTDKWGNVVQEAGSVDEADYLNTPVRSGSGTYAVPLSYLAGPQDDYSALGIAVTSTETVKVDDHFLPGSSITSQREGLYRVEVTN